MLRQVCWAVGWRCSAGLLRGPHQLRIIISVAFLAFIISASPSAGRASDSPAAILGGPSLSDPAGFSGGDDVTARPQVEQARVILNDQLADYPRARFQNVSLRSQTQSDGGVSYYFCGQINAPNAFGGMTGWKPFWINPNPNMPSFMAMMVEPVRAPQCVDYAPVDDVDYSSALTGS